MIAAFIVVAAAPAQAAGLALQSPDGAVVATVATRSDGQPVYSLGYRGQQLLRPSARGFLFERYQHLGPGTTLREVGRRSGEDRYTPPAGKTSSARDRYNELTVEFLETGAPKRRFEVVFRAYDGGLAFRYRIPDQSGLRELRLAGEDTQFLFPANYDCHGLNIGRFESGHEGEYDPVAAASIRPQHLYEPPIVCRTGPAATTIAFAEADLRDYAGMYLSRPGNGDLGLEVRLSPRLDDPNIAVRADLEGKGLVSPWRLIMVGDNPGRLIESTLVTSLNPPPEGDFNWVKPGKYAWDWWNGPILSGVASAGMNNATIRGFIDFASQNGLEYMLIDDGWYVNSFAAGALLPGADNMRSIPEIDLPALVRYAGERNVGLWLWVHWKLIDRNMKRSLPFYAGLGIKGIKVDFMDRDDQEMVEFYHRLMRTAAKHRLMVNLHGAYRPTGLTRTYPNYITQEGVLGAEYNKWSRRITATHNVTIPFTRGLLGPFDYTPGGFGNASPEEFRIQYALPMVQTTRGHALAMYVVYESPFQGVVDSPDRYRSKPDGLDFIRLVPTSWDETRVLSGAIGEHIVVARRTGRDWYVGAMTNEQARTTRVPLSFLPPGRFDVRIWRDGAEPTSLVTESRSATARDSIALALAASGGGVIRITPAR
jgi:alpha-glucosidase